MRTENFSGTSAGILVPIGAAHGTQALAVYPAQRFHGKREKDLLTENIADRQLRSCEEGGTRVLFSQLDVVFVVQVLVVFAKEEIE
jgi:hypothetical protein